MSQLEIRKKTDVQFNGEKFNELWTIPYQSDVDKEFKDRYNKINDEFNILMDEVYWNKLLYDKDECEIKFKPVINNTYHLYKRENGKYYLSMISPNEWKSQDYIDSFKFLYSGKWERKKGIYKEKIN